MRAPEQRPRLDTADALGRREFFAWAGRRGIVLGVATASLPAFLAACAREEDAAEDAAAVASPAADGARAIVGDVMDFELTSDEWEGAFGFVTLRLHKGAVDGDDVFFIRTDASDETFAREEKLVFVPKLAGLVAAKATADAYLISQGVDDQPTVLSSQPGADDYTPAWRIHRATWRGSPRELRSVQDVRRAEAAGDLSIEVTQNVLNASVVKWSNGELPADTDARKEYLGPGQLLDPVDTDAMQVRFKLHECFPGVRYIVTDVSMEPMAGGMKVGHSPLLLKASGAKATGRTNVFMNGTKGPGPMGFQPSVFDSKAGDAQWSPYWDHMTYAWKDEASASVLETEREIHAGRDGGDLEEFPGTPDTKGEIFVVNCPVPVVAPNTFKA